MIGVHLDRRSAAAQLVELDADIAGLGRSFLRFNINAADDTRRAEVLASLSERLPAGSISVVLHSLAFGSLVPLVAPKGKPAVTRAQLDMTLDVMANSLIYWVQDLLRAGFLAEGGRVFAMTSSGSHMVWERYGPVSGAKALLEAHIRQLAVELAPWRITANAVLAGVCRTPALERIPGADRLIQKAEARNPYGRLTRPEDVAACLVELSRPGTYWLNGNVLHIDGGEDVSG